NRRVRLSVRDSPADTRPNDTALTPRAPPAAPGDVRAPGRSPTQTPRVPARRQGAIARTEPVLRPLRHREHDSRLPLLALPQSRRGHGSVAIAPRGFDEHAPHVRVPGLGDRAPPLTAATRVLAGHEPCIRH